MENRQQQQVRGQPHLRSNQNRTPPGILAQLNFKGLSLLRSIEARHKGPLEIKLDALEIDLDA